MKLKLAPLFASSEHNKFAFSFNMDSISVPETCNILLFVVGKQRAPLFHSVLEETVLQKAKMAQNRKRLFLTVLQTAVPKENTVSQHQTVAAEADQFQQENKQRKK